MKLNNTYFVGIVTNQNATQRIEKKLSSSNFSEQQKTQIERTWLTDIWVPVK